MTDQQRTDRFDRQIREFLAWQAEDVRGVPSVGEIAVGIRSRTGARLDPLRVTNQLVWIALAGLLIALAIATAAFVGGQNRLARPLVLTNGLIAYSTQPGWVQVGSTDFAVGGGIFLVREGEVPQLIVDRGLDMTTNVCPLFSPDGSMLVYGERHRSARSLVVLGISPSGDVSETARLSVPGNGMAPCAEWARDGTALVYRDRRDTPVGANPDLGSLLLTTLAGSVLPVEDHDPQLDFIPSIDHPAPDSLGVPLLSPDGSRAVLEDERRLLVTRADGSDPRVIGPQSFYSIATWSPDGSRVLAMEDSTAVMIVAISVEEPYERIVMAPSITINGFRSYPGRGDVSWQPTFTTGD
ncbi:MAG: hypothetical protein ACXWX1_12630 [Aeromicrobium sp.]